ncbi:hypothetical protein QAD02_007157 [Eretmocerus hayati]|uniref:Uncharacterized protein n=1 Tax=Eretmocerus hayati TaxID=131215 RepID=A0ACC2N2U3_9HYME|nr:hypothetical protein QAD02_007157 [Eretmocerus hayati]
MISLETNEGYVSDNLDSIAIVAVGAFEVNDFELQVNAEALDFMVAFQRRRSYPVVVSVVVGLFELVLGSQYYRIYSVRYNLSLGESRALYPLYNMSDAFHSRVKIRVEPHILPIFVVIYADGFSWRVLYRRQLTLEEWRRGSRLVFCE